MTRRQFSTPLLIRDGQARHLRRLVVGETSFDEAWFKRLLFDNPSLLPVAEIDLYFAGPISVARELHTGAGQADILFVNGSGEITLVESKLIENPEARREVVAQLLDYASRMAQWSYEDMDNAVRNAKSNAERNSLLQIVRNAHGKDLDEGEFRARVTQNLRSGHLLLLIVGDEIHENLEYIADFLQRSPHLKFKLALVEIALFREDAIEDGALFVQPRVVARTVEFPRIVLDFKGARPEVTVEDQPGEDDGGEHPRGPMPPEEFYRLLGEAAGAKVASFAEEVVREAEKQPHGLTVEWMDAGPVLKYVHIPTGQFFTFGQLHYEGFLAQTFRLYIRFKQLGLPMDICLDYFDDAANLIDGAKRATVTRKRTGEKRYEAILFGENPGKNDLPPLAPLVARKDEWFAAIDKAVGRIQAALQRR